MFRIKLGWRLRQDVVTDSSARSRTIREADRSHASGPPSSSEGRMPELLDQAENTMEGPIVIYSMTTSTLGL